MGMGESVWVGIKTCGCVVSVCRNDGKAEHIDEAKREMLADGLSVVFAPRDVWERDYLPVFLNDCTHEPTA